jgi:hypothetical protein
MRIWIASPSGGMSEVLTTASPVEAEAHYLRLAMVRTPEPASLTIDPMRGDLVAPARYRLDAGWHAGAPREQLVERWRQLWAPADQWAGPTPEQLRGLVAASGMSGSEIARHIGVQPRTWRRWLADPEGEASHVPISYSTWIAALRLTGLLPDDEHTRRAVLAPQVTDRARADELLERIRR